MVRRYFYKIVTREGERPKRLPLSEITIASVGGFLGFGLIAYLALKFESPILIASLGASASLIYSVPSATLSQPRNVIGGHVISALVGILCFMLLGSNWYSVAIAVSLAIFMMLFAEAFHPPGGATAAIAVLTHQSFHLALVPVAVGAIILVGVALLVNNLFTTRKYPSYWL